MACAQESRTGSDSDNEEFDEEMDDIKKDLLLGHLLAKVARLEQQKHQSIRVLPSLAMSLADLQLLPRYALLVVKSGTVNVGLLLASCCQPGPCLAIAFALDIQHMPVSYDLEIVELHADGSNGR